jgi:Raf kinase inhibitor-like YbhB/YbcL family protein
MNRVTGAFTLRGAVLVAVIAMQLSCTRANSLPDVPSLELRSSSFSGGLIAKECSCDGRNTSPELSWDIAPERTQSFALTATDKDSLFGFSFVHWVIYNIPEDKRELPAGVAKDEQLPDGSRQGHNDYDKFGYVGPCPPGHSAHRYAFDLYALDTKLELPSGASKKQLLKAIQGHVLAKGGVTGRYRH